MKKLLCIMVAIFIATPAMAAVTITCTDLGAVDGNYPGEIEVRYEVDNASDLARGFALDIQLTDGADINDVNVSGDYWIHPGSVVIAGGIITNHGTAIASGNGAVTSNGATLEMGSLYVGEANAPDPNGFLCTFTVSKNCTVNITGNATRGNVVLESGTSQEVSSSCVVTSAYGDCYPLAMPDWQLWDDLGRPSCWCFDRQCYGDADGTRYGSQWSGGFYWVGTPDLGILQNAWFVREPPDGNGIATIPNGICADFDHTMYGSQWSGGFYRVGTPDLGVLQNAWFVKEPPDGNGIPDDCQTP